MNEVVQVAASESRVCDMKMRVYETGADDFPRGVDQFIDATLEAFPNMNDFRTIECDDSWG